MRFTLTPAGAGYGCMATTDTSLPRGGVTDIPRPCMPGHGCRTAPAGTAAGNANLRSCAAPPARLVADSRRHPSHGTKRQR